MPETPPIRVSLAAFLDDLEGFFQRAAEGQPVVIQLENGHEVRLERLDETEPATTKTQSPPTKT